MAASNPAEAGTLSGDLIDAWAAQETDERAKGALLRPAGLPSPAESVAGASAQ